MSRANRTFLPGHVWHITHRCHRRDYLLELAADRRGWLRWLQAACDRYDLSVLNYMATSNHVHLLVWDQGRGEIARSMQLIAGQTAQVYNRRESRRGAFWADRYHATAVDRDDHLMRCLVYIDLNMVRAGAVNHPSEWGECGYREIHGPASGFRIIDMPRLARLCGLADEHELRHAHHGWVESALGNGLSGRRESCWTESVAVGSRTFVEAVEAQMGVRMPGRRVVDDGGTWQLRDSRGEYAPRPGPAPGDAKKNSPARG